MYTKRMWKYIWPLLSALGIFDVIILHAGDGLDAPGFWLIPIGAIMTVGYLFHTSYPAKHAIRFILLVTLWVSAFFTMATIRYGWFSEPNSFDTLNWILPSITLAVLACIMSVVCLRQK
jgi:phosphatidylserine synthase